jgi:hypothetical protein
MENFAGLRAERSHSFVVAVPLAEAFELFTPEGERLWAHGWDPVYIHPADGRTEQDMVFLTSHNDESTIWTLVRHDPPAAIVEYLRVTPGSRIASVMVQCAVMDEAKTRVTVMYRFTGLSDAGNDYVRSMDEPQFSAFIDGWGTAISAALAARAG